MVEFTLTKAVTSYGEKVSKITLREPAGAEVRRIGSPLVFTPDGGMDFNMDRVGKYLEVLASPPLTPNAVNEIAACDWLGLATTLAPFFTPSAASMESTSS